MNPETNYVYGSPNITCVGNAQGHLYSIHTGHCVDCGKSVNDTGEKNKQVLLVLGQTHAGQR